MISNGYKNATSGKTYSFKSNNPIGSSSKKTFMKAAKHVKSKPSITSASSHIQIDSNIIRLRAELAALSSPQAKILIIEKFVSKNPEKKFFKISLTEKGRQCDLRVINMAILGIKKHLISKETRRDGSNSYTVGGVGHLPQRKVDQIDKNLFDVAEMDLMDENTQKEFLRVVENAMGIRS